MEAKLGESVWIETTDEEGVYELNTRLRNGERVQRIWINDGDLDERIPAFIRRVRDPGTRTKEEVQYDNSGG